MTGTHAQSFTMLDKYTQTDDIGIFVFFVDTTYFPTGGQNDYPIIG